MMRCHSLKHPRLEPVLGLLLALAGAVAAQSPTRPGKLAITSTPAGASITINGRAVPQRTDTTFVVVAGEYRVTVSGGPGNLNCAAQTVRVESNGSTGLHCTATGWAR